VALQASKSELEDIADIPPTARMLSWARNSAAYRLSKAMMSEKQLRDAIRRKALQKFEDITGTQVDALADAAARFGYEQKALDDHAFAEASVRSGSRGGKSRRAIALKLSSKGIDAELAHEAIAAADDFHAALVYARRRGLGPFRRRDKDGNIFAKEIASLARNGFGYDIGRRVLSLSREEAEDLLLAGPSDSGSDG
jgi:regulatory protein